MKLYAGIGSRSTPPSILEKMSNIAYSLAADGWVLRSGGALGADTAFEQGCDSAVGKKEIYLPWKGFNNNESPLHDVTAQAINLTREYHPSPNLLTYKRFMAMFHGRNAQQVLGQNLDSPIAFIVCWTPDGCESDEDRVKETGGTGQAISIAACRGIPVFNLANDDAADKLLIHIRINHPSKQKTSYTNCWGGGKKNGKKQSI